MTYSNKRLLNPVKIPTKSMSAVLPTKQRTEIVSNGQLLKSEEHNFKMLPSSLTAKEADRPRPQWEAVSSSNSETKTLWCQWDSLVVQDGLLCRRWHDKKTATERFQIVISASRRYDVLKYHHDIPSSGYQGDEKTLQRLQLKFYWPSMKETVEDYCKNCHLCIAWKPHAKVKAPLGSYVVGGPFKRIQIDIFGPLPKTASGNKYILVICDCLTK